MGLMIWDFFCLWPMLHHHRYELGRQAAMTKLSSNKTVWCVRVWGGNFKFRALHLDTVNFLWGSEAVTRKAHVLDVVYIMLSSNNELVTQTLVKNAIVQVDAAPFCQWYSQHCGLDIDKKKKAAVLRKDSEVICPCFCECLANSALFVFLSICSSHGASQQGFSEQAYLELHCWCNTSMSLNACPRA